jgi:non-ribosomal peptide synthetase-like protein
VDSVPVDGHFFDDLGADSMVMARFCARVRKRDDLPTVSMKDVYAHSTIRALATALAPAGTAMAAPVASPLMGGLAEVLAEVIGVDQVSVDGHFFDDLGADSMVMARFCARVRKRDDLPTVSMKDVYAHSTLRGLAAAFAPAAPAETPVATPAPTGTRPAAEPMPAAGTPLATKAVKPPTTWEYVLCAVLQLVIFLGYSFLAAVIFEVSFRWISAGEGLLDYYVRAVEATSATFAIACTLPILLKWVLVGRGKPRQIRIWSLGYVRFWAVKTLIASNPLVLFAGSPLYSVYLRALGAKVGRGTVILSRHAPAYPDLLTIGARTVIRKEAYFNCYRAHAGLIQTGTVTLGDDVFVGEKAILDIGTSIGDGAQLGHTSSLHAGQSVPAGEHWHGSPGERTDADYRGVETTHLSNWRRVGYTALELLNVVFLILPLVFGAVAALLGEVPWLAALLEAGPRAFTTWSFYAVALVSSLVLFVGSKLIALLVVFTVPRLLNSMIKPDRTYRLYGFYYSVHKTIVRLSNRKFFHELFGDSSYVAYYVRSLGYDLGTPLVQTGSNFGNEVKHENPHLVSVGSGTVIASGHTFINADYSSTSFRLARTSVGPNNFLGNDIVYPPQGKTGADCLLATKVLVPIDGDVREGVGLLGSPAFEIPRTVARDSKFAEIAHGEDFPRLLAAKNRYNLATMGWFLLVRWFYYFVITLTAFMAIDLYDTLGALSIVMLNLVVLVFSVFYFALVERASTRFRGVRPTYCSIYQVDFWRMERFFKFSARVGLHRIFVGTPYKAVLFRMVGVNLGKRLFDDGASMSEKNIVTLGDDVTLNAGSVLQCHSQEDYAFKSDRITVGSRCTLGVGAFVHYGVTIGDGAVIAPDSFLMKGEDVPAHKRWGGNPAEEMAPFSPVDAQVPGDAGTHRALEMAR